MPGAESYIGPDRVGLDQIHGDPRKAMAPFRQVWNTYNQTSTTGTSVTLAVGAEGIIVPARPERRHLIATIDSPTGTANVFLSMENPAAPNSGIGPLAANGDNFIMDGFRGIYPGTLRAYNGGSGPVRINVFEGWTNPPPVE